MKYYLTNVGFMISATSYQEQKLIKHQIGSIIQQAFLVEDLDSSIQDWLALGVGPFFVSRHPKYKTQVYRGQSIESDFSAAFAYSGDVQIELIQLHDDKPSVFEEFLRSQGFGVHHIGVLTDDIAADIEALELLGYSLIQRMTSLIDVETAFMSFPHKSGATLELIQRSPTLDAGFGMMKQITESWDGTGQAIHEF
ncbi:VOC family protein [Pseudomonas sp. FP597]|uniref:VOC family protein n=1 Tax=Pseudomonas lactucae TaxID=2813360 RepID=A0A9X0YDM8_9PSED|nr:MULTISPECIES: VOC family protein [Pseudomonas]MBN2977186.1 VOC family protein [Pseudomonas lactucae]MBN2988275.1 VOC family protein [Pseudomonas lactucae]WLI08791.1 VOC family protein [Pseudomonas sp. FP597]